MRRLAAVLLVASLAAAVACADDDGSEAGGAGDRSEEPAVAEPGFVDPEAFRQRQDEYLAHATEELSPTSALNVLAHAERAARDDSFEFDGASPELDESLAKIDRMDDTSDFDLLYLINLWYSHRDALDDGVREDIEARILAFKYWYTEPRQPGDVDNKWYWSENHRIIFHTLEYLAGQAFPEERFGNDGRTGEEHRAHAEALIERWIDEKVRFGFSEWHSDVYYQKDVTPLLTLVEFAEDEALAERAAMVLDLVLFDIATKLQSGNFGATHGRSYMKDKSTALDQNIFGLAKLLFDDTSEPYQARDDPGAVLLARAREYRLPEAVRRVAVSEARSVDRERMGVPLDPSAPVSEDVEAPYGYGFEDPENVDFWWERGAYTTWQGVRLVFATADRYDLWETDLFEPFLPLRDAVGGDPEVGRSVAQSLAPMVALGLLSEANTYTYRAPDAMLSSVQDHRPGAFGEQYHAWQATLDEHAIVFTTHPKDEPEEGTEWPDSDGYWTGTGSMPRTAQQGTAAVHLYAPAFEAPDGPPLDAFSYLDYTHAYFPQKHFDEVVTDPGGHWVFGQRGDGYVALWSQREVAWRDHDPERVFTHGLTEPFDLVAEGGATNAWVVEVGDAERWGSFSEFREAMLAAPVQATDLGPGEDGLPQGFEVRYGSPTEGELRLGPEGPFSVDGEEVALDGYPRYDNPWATTPFESELIEIREGGHALTLDFAAGARTASGP